MSVKVQYLSQFSIDNSVGLLFTYPRNCGFLKIHKNLYPRKLKNLIAYQRCGEKYQSVQNPRKVNKFHLIICFLVMDIIHGKLTSLITKIPQTNRNVIVTRLVAPIFISIPLNGKNQEAHGLYRSPEQQFII